MVTKKRRPRASQRVRRLREAIEVLLAIGFGPRQSNDIAGYTLLALLDLKPNEQWSDSSAPLRGITPIIDFVRQHYGVKYAPNTRETIRDEAVKHFTESGMLVRNPDDPTRPTNSGRTVYQLESRALELCRSFGTPEWVHNLESYYDSREHIRNELARDRAMARIPLVLPSGDAVSISPGGQNPLIKAVIEEFCPRFIPGGTVVYIGDAENKFLHLVKEYVERLGIVLPPAAKMPDVVLHDRVRNWLVLIEAVTSAGPVDGKRRGELKQLFSGCTSGLVFVTAFATRASMRSFLTQISWETEVWIAENPEHLIHFNGERFLGPYPDVLPMPPPTPD